ncbi:hypothetical protein [Oceanobacillus kapialis]|uniref:Uncharacterized protein n=1 Tax=Oceanobacillus kapialis TaxID=481353 RepID=A0ABW5Q3G5_9BACI
MNTLPTSFWVIYIIFVSSALLTAIISNARNRLIPFAYVAIILSIGTPLFSFLYIIQRTDGSNEWDYLLKQISNGHLPAIILLLCYLYLLFWLILFLWKNFGATLKKYSLLLWNKLKNLQVWRKLRRSQEE